MRRVVSRRLFWRPAAGSTAGAKWLSWPMSKRRRARRHMARSPTWSIRWRSKPRSASMPCSISSARLSPAQRHAVRQERSAPLVTELERWMIETRDKLSRGHDLTKAFNYMLRRWSSFTGFLEDGRICLSNNAAERAPARHRSRQKVLAVLRFRSRRTARCRSLQPDRQRQDEPYRPAGLARRRPRPTARLSGPSDP